MHNLDDVSWKKRKNAIKMWESGGADAEEQSIVRGVLARNANASFGSNCYIAPDCNFYTDKAELGNNVLIGSQVTLRGNISLGNDVSVNPQTNIIGNVKVGNAVRIASGVQIFGFNHGFDRVDRFIKDQPISSEGISIEDGTWIGAGVSIVDGVTIGAHSIVAAGATVTKSFPKFSVIGGTPAKLLKNRLTDIGKRIVVNKYEHPKQALLSHLELPSTGYLDVKNQTISGWVACHNDEPLLSINSHACQTPLELSENRPDVVGFLNRTNQLFRNSRVFSFRIQLKEPNTEVYLNFDSVFKKLFEIKLISE